MSYLMLKNLYSLTNNVEPTRLQLHYIFKVKQNQTFSYTNTFGKSLLLSRL